MASTEEGAVMEKIDMSLDDIIKLNRQGGKRSQRGNFRAREITRGIQQAKRAQPETVGGRKSQRGAAGTRGVQRGFLNVRGLRGAVGARGSYRGTMGAVGSRQGAMGLPRGSRRARGLQRGAMGVRGLQRGAMGVRGLQRGAMGVRGLQRGAMGVRGLQRGAMGVRGLQRGARAARELQVGAMGPNGFQRNASGARAVLRGPMKKRAEPKHQKAPNFGCFPPAASGAPMMTGRGRGVGGVGMGGSIWGLARGGRAVRAGTPWRRGIASGSTALKRRLGGLMPGHMAAGVRPRVRLESRRLGSGQESQQDLTTSTTSSFQQAVRIRQREARRALLNLRRGLQTQTAVPSLKQKRRPSAKQRNKQMGESSVTSSSLLTVSITNPQAPISNKQRSLRPPVLAKPAPTQPKGVPLRYNIRQLSNQTKLTLNERFSTLQRERVQRPGSHAARLVALH